MAGILSVGEMLDAGHQGSGGSGRAGRHHRRRWSLLSHPAADLVECGRADVEDMERIAPRDATARSSRLALPSPQSGSRGACSTLMMTPDPHREPVGVDGARVALDSVEQAWVRRPCSSTPEGLHGSEPIGPINPAPGGVTHRVPTRSTAW